jgi:hypothetical protein
MQNSMSIALKKYKLIALLALSSFGCGTKGSSPVMESLHKLNVKPLVANQAYLVVPNAGCDGCITYAEDFIKNNTQQYPNLIYILTRISSPKILKLKFGDILQNKNVILDTASVFVYPEQDKNIYPAILYTRNDEIEKIEYQNPETDGINNLRRYYRNEK